MRWVLFLFYTYNIEDFPSFELIRNPTRVKFLMPETGTALTWSTAFILISLFLFLKFVLYQYNAFRAKRRDAGYSDEDLEESYGFLLFDDVNKVQTGGHRHSWENAHNQPNPHTVILFFFVLKANALRETGVLTGNSTCTTLGDPSKGIYIYIHVFFILHRVLPSLSLSLISYDIYVLKLNVKILF